MENNKPKWVKYNLTKNAIPYLHFYDVVEVKISGDNGGAMYAHEIDWNNTSDPVTAYRLIQKAEFMVFYWG